MLIVEIVCDYILVFSGQNLAYLAYSQANPTTYASVFASGINFLASFSSPALLLAMLVLVLAGFFFLRKIWIASLRKAVDRKLQAILSGKASSSHPTQMSSGYSVAKENRMQNPGEAHSVSEKFNSPTATKESDKTDAADIQFSQVAELLPDIAFEADLQGNISHANQWALKALDVSQQEYKEGVNVFSFLPPEEHEKARENLLHIARDEKKHATEYKLITKKGKRLHVLAYSAPIFKDGEVSGFRGLLVDVSRRRKNEDTIKTLQDIVAYTELGICVFRMEQENSDKVFRLEMVNQASGKIIKALHSDNKGHTLTEISPVFKHQKLDLVFAKVLQTGKPEKIEDFEYFSAQKEKAAVLLLNIYPLPDQKVAVLIEDISQIKKTEQSLKMTRFGIENAYDMILWLNESAEIVYANETAVSKFGYRKEQLLQMNITQVDTRVTMSQWYDLVLILESKPSLTMESINKAADGVFFPVEVSINKFVYDAKNYYFTFIRDISERKRNDDLEQKIQVARQSAALKQQFLANMSHEIRTPMTGIMGMTSLLMRSNLTPPQLEYVRNIKISSENLLNIINDVLDLSKIEAGRMELKPSKVNIRDFVADIKEVFHHQAEKKGIALSASVEPIAPQFILVDENRLKQIINNLLSNAIKFTDEGEVSMRIGLKSNLSNSLTLYCQVKDTGVGISPKNQKQIFEKFTQIDSSLIRPFEGTGLGLAICRELTNLMGGEISVESDPGNGSKFTFTFKAEIDKKDLIETAEYSSRDFLNLDLNILHVEDKLLNQKVVAYILLNAGCNVDFVNNGREALNLYKPGRYDIILMDIQMPVMDGITAFRELKRLYGSKLCPVIGLSANAMEGDARKYMEMGLDDYIVKPFTPRLLYEKLQHWSGNLNASQS